MTAVTSRAERIVVVHADRPPASVTAATVDELRRRGAEVDIWRIGGAFDITDLHLDHDLFVLKHSYQAALTVGAALHAAGAPLLNPFPAVAACRDKAVACSILARAGLPVPRTHLVVDPLAAVPLLDNWPVVIKPNTGSKGMGVRVVRTRAELGDVDPALGPFIVQRFHAPEGLDRKLYRIGDHIHCVGRPWPASTAEAKQGVPIGVDPLLRRLVLGVGDALGLDLYGVDVVVSGGQHYVVDVSAFPGFKGVPNADRLLAERILQAARSGITDAKAGPGGKAVESESAP